MINRLVCVQTLLLVLVESCSFVKMTSSRDEKSDIKIKRLFVVIQTNPTLTKFSDKLSMQLKSKLKLVGIEPAILVVRTSTIASEPEKSYEDMVAAFKPDALLQISQAKVYGGATSESGVQLTSGLDLRLRMYLPSGKGVIWNAYMALWKDAIKGGVESDDKVKEASEKIVSQLQEDSFF